MPIHLMVTVNDKDVENLLLYLESQGHLSALAKREVVHKVDSLLKSLDADNYRATSVAVTADVDGIPLSSAMSGRIYSQPCLRPRCDQEDQG